jgi:NADPH:quinone reductase-like Zn-dependent oxidoreductase
MRYIGHQDRPASPQVSTHDLVFGTLTSVLSVSSTSDGNIADHARTICPDGVDTALELVGTRTLPDTLPATRVHRVVCFTGMLSNQWTRARHLPDRLPPTPGPPHLRRRRHRPAVATGDAIVPIHRTYCLDEIAVAHADMEAGRATGKLVVLP